MPRDSTSADTMSVSSIYSSHDTFKRPGRTQQQPPVHSYNSNNPFWQRASNYSEKCENGKFDRNNSICVVCGDTDWQSTDPSQPSTFSCHTCGYSSSETTQKRLSWFRLSTNPNSNMQTYYEADEDSMSISSVSLYDSIDEITPATSASSSVPPHGRARGYSKAGSSRYRQHNNFYDTQESTTTAHPLLPELQLFPEEQQEQHLQQQQQQQQLHHQETEDLLTGVNDHDFASFTPAPGFHSRLTADFEPVRDAASPRTSIHGRPVENKRFSILSMQQHAEEPPLRPVKWFERVEAASFQLKITPRAAMGKKPASASSGAVSASSGAAATSSAPPGHPTAGGPGANLGDLPLDSLLDDPSALSRLLVSALFTMPSVPEKDSDAKTHQLGLVPARSQGAKQFAMKHEKLDPLTGMPVANEAGKRLVFRIVLREKVA